MDNRSLPWLLIGLVALLCGALGWRLPLTDSAAALLACLAAGPIWRYWRNEVRDGDV